MFGAMLFIFSYQRTFIDYKQKYTYSTALYENFAFYYITLFLLKIGIDFLQILSHENILKGF